MGNMRLAWENGRSVLFHCNSGEYRAPTALAVMLSWITGTQALGWLPTLWDRRDIGGFFRELYHHRVVDNDPQWTPNTFENYVLACRIDHFECHYDRFLDFAGLPGTPRSAPATPRTQAAGYRRREEEASAVSPLADDIQIVYSDAVGNPIDDPAPHWRPPMTPPLRSPRGRSSSPRRGSRSPRHRNRSPCTPPLPPAWSHDGLPLWVDRAGTPPHSPRAPSPCTRPVSHFKHAVVREFGSGVPAHFGAPDSLFREPCTVVVPKPMRVPFDFSGLGAADGVVNPATAPSPQGPYNANNPPPPPPLLAEWIPTDPAPVAAML